MVSLAEVMLTISKMLSSEASPIESIFTQKSGFYITRMIPIEMTFQIIWMC